MDYKNNDVDPATCEARPEEFLEECKCESQTHYDAIANWLESHRIYSVKVAALQIEHDLGIREQVAFRILRKMGFFAMLPNKSQNSMKATYAKK